MRSTEPIVWYPLTPERWSDFEQLFGPRGACGGCWCMHWRLERGPFERQKGEANRRAMHAIVAQGQIPGILGYSEATPIGWCAVAPRSVYRRLERSRIMAPVDDQPVWSIVCFFVAKPWRGRGISTRLVRAAAAFAEQSGAQIIEGYPVDPRRKPMPPAFAWTGLAASFKRAGFKEVLRRSPTRPIMRRSGGAPRQR